MMLNSFHRLGLSGLLLALLSFDFLPGHRCFAWSPSSQEPLVYASETQNSAIGWIAMSSENRAPDDLTVEVDTVSKTPRFIQLRYGTTGSIRVCLLIDQQDDQTYSLFVDLNRDRRIEASELIAGTGRDRTFELATQDAAELTVKDRDAEALKDQMLGERSVTFRLGRSAQRHYVATRGGMVGFVTIDNDQVPVRLIDSNANGFFIDRSDRLLLDLDGNGAFDPIREQFANRPHLTIDSIRYQVGMNLSGQKLTLARNDEAGSIKLVVKTLASDCERVALHVVVTGDDHCVYALDNEDVNTLPVGRYHVSACSVLLADRDGQRWGFSFLFGGGEVEDFRFEVTADSTTEVNLMDGAKFGFRETTYHPDSGHVMAYPHLTLGNGLYLTYSGPNVLDTNQTSSTSGVAPVYCSDPAGRSLGMKLSGFS